jgi:transcriptional regulator with XRE-family HTH domain
VVAVHGGSGTEAGRDGVDEARVLGLRLRELRGWRGLTLREAAGLAGLSFSFWSQIERGEKSVTTRRALDAIVGVLRVHPTELTGQPWTLQDPAGDGTPAELVAIETALERYQLGTDPGLTVRDWPQIAADLERLVKLRHWDSDYAAMGELAPVLLGELRSA